MCSSDLEDAEFLEKEFVPEFSIEDIVNVPRFSIILKLMIDSVTSRAFSAKALPPFKAPHENYREQIIENSRKKYGVDRHEIEKVIEQWTSVYSVPEQKQYARKQGNQKLQAPYSQNSTPKERGHVKRDNTISLEDARKRFPPMKNKPTPNIPRPSYLKNIKNKPQPDVKGLRELLNQVEKEKE